MIISMLWDDPNLTKVLKENGVVVMPTDTLYGIVGRAENQETVERIYKVRKRNPAKPCVVLIGDVSELKKFGITLTEEQKKTIREYWPTPTSIILDCPDEKFSYLHRGTKTLAFRVPAPQALRDLLMKVGSLVAPSANTEALPPCENIAGAKKYFGGLVDLYVDGGTIVGQPSKIIALHKKGSVSILRE